MFQKPATTIDWQIEKLIERGLQIEKKNLQNITSQMLVIIV